MFAAMARFWLMLNTNGKHDNTNENYFIVANDQNMPYYGGCSNCNFRKCHSVQSADMYMVLGENDQKNLYWFRARIMVAIRMMLLIQ
jgi:hypothetical protein